MKILSLLATLTLILGNAAFGSYHRDSGRSRETQFVLENAYLNLSSIFQICGRYPTTVEGLSAFRKRPSGFLCPTGNKDPWPSVEWVGPKDGWDLPLDYQSDGKTYRITTSHGYFVTSNSALSIEHKMHWENPEYKKPFLPPGGYESWSDYLIFTAIFLLGTLALIFRRSLSVKFSDNAYVYFSMVTVAFGAISFIGLLLNIAALFRDRN